MAADGTVGLNGRLTLSFDHTYGSAVGSTSVGNLTESNVGLAGEAAENE